jgi:hypothetical protein
VNRRRITDIFEGFINPSVPLAFLFGTLVLAVFGNATYDLLLELLNPQRDTALVLRLLYLSGGSLLLLGVVVVGLWAWYNTYRRKQPPPLTEAIKLTQSYPALVVFVSENPNAAEKTAIQHHLQNQTLSRLWLIVSREAREKAQTLTSWLRQQPNGEAIQLTQLPLSDAFDIASAYSAVLDTLETADDMIDQLIVDITAGTKQMSAGAVLACREYGVPMQYVRGTYDAGRVQPDTPAQLMKVLL